MFSKLFGLSLKAGKIIFSFLKKSKLKFLLILLQVFDSSPQFNVNHSTKSSSSQRSGAWFEGPCQDVTYRIQDVKQLLPGCREQLGEKDTEFDSKVSYSFKTVNEIKKIVLF